MCVVGIVTTMSRTAMPQTHEKLAKPFPGETQRYGKAFLWLSANVGGTYRKYPPQHFLLEFLWPEECSPVDYSY